MLGSARSAFMKKASGGASLPAAIAAYGFSEGSGTTTADASGNGHTLTLNGTSWTASGHTGSALTNTTTAQGATSFFTSPAAAITLMAWVKPLDLTLNTTHFALGFLDAGGSTYVGIFTQRFDFGTHNILQCDLKLNGTLNEYTGPALTVGTWVHLALTYDGSTVVVYKDGVAVNTTAATGAITAGDGLYVAGWSLSSPEDTDVIVDDARVFNTALTGAQIVTAMNTPVS
jgi:hypothetical protein